jgi:hypothetical protein
MVYEGMPGMLAWWATYHLTRRWATLPTAEVAR